MNQEYFSIQLSSTTNLAIPLANMGAVVQFDTDNVCVVPGVAEFWYGVVNFKGSLLWILDSDRYFRLDSTQKLLTRKLTAVILKQQQKQSKKQVAIVVQQLGGIVELEENILEESGNNIVPNLANCSVLTNIIETKKTYILNPSNLLQQINEQSSLISV